MNSPKKLQVFISSTYEDMKEERQAAVEAILESGHIPAGMELFAAGSSEQLKVIQRWIDASDVYMLILGGRYGSIEPTSGLSYVECEFDYAVSVGKPVFSLVMSKDLLDKKVRSQGISSIEQSYTELLNKFKKKVLSRLCAIYSSNVELQKESIKSIIEIQQTQSLVGWVRGNDTSISKIGSVQQYYYPFLDPMKTKTGKPIKTKKGEDTWNPYVYSARFNNSGNSRFIYGPYRTLPVTGKYSVAFRLKANLETLAEEERQILVLDVYDYYGGGLTLASRAITTDELSDEYKVFALEFLYASISSRLEYRIGYIGSKSAVVTIFVDQIVIERLAD